MTWCCYSLLLVALNLSHPHLTQCRVDTHYRNTTLTRIHKPIRCSIQTKPLLTTIALIQTSKLFTLNMISIYTRLIKKPTTVVICSKQNAATAKTIASYNLAAALSPPRIGLLSRSITRVLPRVVQINKFVRRFSHRDEIKQRAGTREQKIGVLILVDDG